MLDVCSSGYYAWRKKTRSARDKANEDLLGEIKRVHEQNKRRYGSPRIYKALRNEGIYCGRHRVARLMRRHRIVAQRELRYKRATISKHGRSFAENLLQRRFNVAKPNHVWAGDITCFWTGSGWLHLAVVMDLYSRRIVGWAMTKRMTDDLSIEALKMAIEHRGPQKSLMHHSDQGSQYASERFRDLLSDSGIAFSMSRPGNCYDNAVVESFFKTLKFELTKGVRYKTREQAKTSLFEYIEVFYNRKRLHSTLGYMSPVDYEALHLT